MEFDQVKDYPLHKIKCTRSYQRKPEEERWKPIAESMKEDGYCPAYPIIITPDMNIIDGQHRWIAAYQAGLKTIPCCMALSLKDEQEEAKFFTELNSYNSKLSPLAFWNARKEAGHPLARLLYELNENPSSLLKGRIALKGHKYDENFAISIVFVFVNTALREEVEYWGLSKEKNLCKIAHNFDTAFAISRINPVVRAFFDCFGEQKKNNPMAYAAFNVTAFCTFYLKLRATGFFTSINEGTIEYTRYFAKMKKFVFPANWRGLTQWTRFCCLAEHWNSGKRMFRIDTGCPRDIKK